MKYLITSSLLDSFDYLKSCPESSRKRAIDDFVAMLKREERPTSEACQRGKDFENLICDNCNEMKLDDFYGVAEWYWKQKNCKDLEKAVWVSEKFFEACKGGDQQVRVMKDIMINGSEYHLFGYADVVFPDKIIDIKTAGRYKGEDYYKSRSQHLIYALCTGVKKFEYLVADYKSKKYPCDFVKIPIEINLDEADLIIKKRIISLVSFLKNAGLFEDYEKTFTGLHKDVR